MSDAAEDQAARWTCVWRSMPPALLPWLLIVAGAVARVYVYALNRSLWHDEAALIEGLLEKAGQPIFAPLANLQAAPLGFVLTLMAAVKLLGPSEYAFRLLALLCALALLPLMYLLARKMLNPTGAIFALAVVSLSEHFIYYASEAKPYSLDALLTCVLLLSALWYFGRPGAVWPGITLAAAGAVATWFSYPSIFVLGGIAVAMVVSRIAASDRRGVVRDLSIWVVWGLSFAPHYILWIQQQAASDYMQRFWAEAFMPLDAYGVSALKWLILRPFKVLGNPMGFTYPGVAYPLLLIGLVVFIRHRDRLRIAVLATFALVLAASAMKAYPVYGRLLLFSGPLVAIMLGCGAARLLSADATASRWPSRLLVLISLLPLVYGTAHYLKSPWQEQIGPVSRHLAANLREGDHVMVASVSRPGLEYYLGLRSLPESTFTIFEAEELDYSRLLSEFRAAPSGRVWLVFSHTMHTAVGSTLRECLLATLDERGTRLDSLEVTRASVYLYELRPPAADASR